MAQLQLDSRLWIGGGGISTEAHCGGGIILTKGGSKGHIFISAPRREKANGRNKDKTYMVGISIAWPIGGRLKVATSSYKGEIRSFRHGLDTARLLKSF